MECLALKNDRSAYAWVYDSRSAVAMPEKGSEYEHAGLTVTLSGMQPGAYSVEFWDTYKGEVVQKATRIIEGSVLSVALPSFVNDIAVKVKPAAGTEAGTGPGRSPY